MRFKGFQPKDFDVFKVDGLDERMEALQSMVSPKLEALGEALSPALSAQTGSEIFPHVARHARRSVNPPDSTWVAFAENKRGYKKHPHFQIGLWESHLFIWFAVINEAEHKSAIAQTYKKHLSDIYKIIPKDYVWSKDHTEPDTVPQSEADLEEMVNRLKNVKKAELLCGRHIKRDNPILKDGEKLMGEIEKTFQTVMPLYEWAKEA
ncbi:MAG TPA: DUF1054 domain-containing protein [Bacillales bacterium]|nr:DUF1054 domain-containing protein [Bacillales bacterium]